MRGWGRFWPLEIWSSGSGSCFPQSPPGLGLSRVGERAPLAGRAIYLWHCDALGRYSIYDLPNASYLRAVGVTDSVGNAAFTRSYLKPVGIWGNLHQRSN